MSWICENCSTSNDDKAKICFVCDERRSELAIRNAKKEKMELRKHRLAEYTSKYSNISLKILTMASLSVAVISIIILFVGIVSNGELSNIVQSWDEIIINLNDKIAEPFFRDIAIEKASLAESYFVSLSDNVVYLLNDVFTNKLAVIGQNVSRVLEYIEIYL